MEYCFCQLQEKDFHLNLCAVCDLVTIDRVHQTVEIETNTVEIEEKGIRLRLTVVDTPGFADAVNNTDWWVLLTLV